MRLKEIVQYLKESPEAKKEMLLILREPENSGKLSIKNLHALKKRMRRLKKEEALQNIMLNLQYNDRPTDVDEALGKPAPDEAHLHIEKMALDAAKRDLK
jgi:hypothetical protein